jgi:hypothetical protein
MGTSKAELREWFNEGVKMGATHMIVVCDTFDYEDYPVFVPPDLSVRDEVNNSDGNNMQRVMEVYDLSMDREAQIAEVRAFHY